MKETTINTVKLIKTTSPAVYRVEDLASLLSISRNTAYELVRSGAIRSVKVGRQYRIPRDAVEEYLRLSI